MILQTKLNKTAFKTADPAEWIIGAWWLLDPVLAGRIAYYCKCVGKKAKLTRGYSSTAEQAALYKEYLNYKETGIVGPNGVKLAAKPGTSWHEFRQAADITYCDGGKTTHPIRWATSAALAAYGLCKPISSEGWHIQAVETGRLGSKAIANWEPEDIAPELKKRFGLADAMVTYLGEYKYAAALAEGLLAGRKDFSAETMKYLYGYKYWISLREKLGM